MQIGDIVAPRGDSGFYLHSGCSAYECAVVAHEQPLILISQEGDMLWSETIKPHYFRVVMKADDETIDVVMKRLYHDYPEFKPKGDVYMEEFVAWVNKEWLAEYGVTAQQAFENSKHNGNQG